MPVMKRFGDEKGLEGLAGKYLCGFESTFKEYEYFITEGAVQGAIPEGLEGTLFTLGPGLTHAYGKRSRHAADGDGLVCSVAFNGSGKAFFRSRFVRTPSFAAEQAANRRRSRGLHDRGTPLAPPSLTALASSVVSTLPIPPLPAFNLPNNPLEPLRRPCNSSLLLWAGRLYALGEDGMPFEIQKSFLETLGETTLNGLLRPGSTVSGACQVVPGRDGAPRLVVMERSQTGVDAFVTFHETDEPGREVLRTQHKVPACVARHLQHFLVTPKHYVLFESSVGLNLEKMATGYSRGLLSLEECSEYRPEQPMRIHLVPRPGQTGTMSIGTVLGPPRVVEAPECVVMRAVSAETDASRSPGGRQQLVLHVVAQQGSHIAPQRCLEAEHVSNSFQTGHARPELLRLTLNLDGAAAEVEEARVLLQHACDNASMIVQASGSQGGRTALYAAAPAIAHPQAWGPNQAVVATQMLGAAGGTGGGAGSSGASPYVTSILPTTSEVQEGQRTSSSSSSTLQAAAQVSHGSQTWIPGPDCFVDAPLLVRKPTFPIATDSLVLSRGRSSGDIRDGPTADAWLLVIVHRVGGASGGQSGVDLCILDADAVAAGPVAVLPLPRDIPFHFQSTWAHEYLGPGKTAPKNWQPLTAVQRLSN